MTLQAIIELCLETNQSRGETYVRAYLQSALDQLAQIGYFKERVKISGSQTHFDLGKMVKRVLSVDGHEAADRSNLSNWNRCNVYYTEKSNGTLYLVCGRVNGNSIYPSMFDFSATIENTPDINDYDYCCAPSMPTSLKLGMVEYVRENMHNDPEQIRRSHAIWMNAFNNAMRDKNSQREIAWTVERI
jgi:hypothetical protein